MIRTFQMFGEKISPFKILLELLVIIAGVSLALIANNWNNERNNQQLVSITLENLVEEIETNQKRIQETFEYHQFIVDSLEAMVASNELDNVKSLILRRGISPPFVQKAAFETAKSNQAFTHMPYKLTSSIYSAYLNQQLFFDYYWIFIETNFGENLLERANKNLAVSILLDLRSITGLERLMMKSNQEALDKIARFANQQ